MRTIFLLILLCQFAFVSPASEQKSRHVVLIVWDGMRPDFVNESNTPTLAALARDGVFFKNNHCSFLSSTEVNGTALATGAYPQHSGVIGNVEYWPEVDEHEPFHTESLEAMRKVEQHGAYLKVSTMAEILHKRGLRTMIAGTKPVVLLHDHAERPADADSQILYEGRTLPPETLGLLTRELGPVPSVGSSKTNRDTWTTRALIGPLWAKSVPSLSVLWLGEPDSTQHATGPGSPQSLAAIRNSDHALAMVIQTLKDKGAHDSTDYIVVSDHGFSSIVGGVNIPDRLQKAGFTAARQFKTNAARGDVLVIPLGGSALIYVHQRDQATIDRLIEFLQKEPYVGGLFTKRPRNGTLPMSAPLVRSPRTPDIVLSYHWTSATNRYGTPGYLTTLQPTNAVPSGALRGTHVSLSPFDLRNILIAAGPNFRSGIVSDIPSGNVDVAPTILHLLGITPPRSMDGRVLHEGLASSDEYTLRVKRREFRSGRKFADGEWNQYLTVVEVNGVRYLEQGNAKFTGKQKLP